MSSRIDTLWKGGKKEVPASPYEEEAASAEKQRASSGREKRQATHHRRNSSSLARWFSNFGKSDREREEREKEREKEREEQERARLDDESLILNHVEDVDVARFTSDLLNDGFRYSTRSLMKAVEVPGGGEEEEEEEGGAEEVHGVELAPTPRGGWEVNAPTSLSAWSMSASDRDRDRDRDRECEQQDAGGELTRRSSYKVLWDTLKGSTFTTAGRRDASKKKAKQKPPIEYVKGTVLSLKPSAEAFAGSVQLRKHLLGLEGDTRVLAALMKDLNKHGASQRASLMFDTIRAEGLGREGSGREGSEGPDQVSLGHLADLYTYTTAISQCGTGQRGALNKALEMFGEMKARSIAINIHAYSALMGVCVKQNECHAAVSVYKELREDARVEPNLVTFNILIDAYNKLGMLQSSVEVLEEIKKKRLLPEARAYNSVISACGKANKGGMAMRVYKMMLKDGVGPTNTTYTSAISACGRSGMVDEAMALYWAMPSMGCQPNVITFSSLISVCERAGDMQLALNIWEEMRARGVAPNLVTYNGLLGCFAKAGAWQDAVATVAEMQAKRIDLDALSYSAVVTACSRAVPSKWREAMQYFEQATKHGFKLETGATTNLVGCLWSTGGVPMQKRALQMLQTSGGGGDNGSSSSSNGGIKIRFNEACESSMMSDSASACRLAMLVWINGYRQDLRSASTYNRPLRSLLFTPGKYACVGSAKDDVVAALKATIQAFSIPAKVIEAGRGKGCVVKTDARHISTWMTTPPAFLVKSLLGIAETGAKGRATSMSKSLPSFMPMLKEEAGLYTQCERAMTAVNAFEAAETMFNGLPKRNLDAFEASIDLRRAILQVIINMSGALKLKETICHDSVQICNKLLATGAVDRLPAPPTCAAALLLIVARANGAQSLLLRNGQILEGSFGVSLDDVDVVEEAINAMLAGQTASISPIRVLSVYLDLLGYNQLYNSNDAQRGNGIIGALVTNATGLVSMAAVDASLAFTPPSIVAAACLSTAFRRSGMQTWPTLLCELTGVEEREIAGTVDVLERLVV